jgi:hypothetical protein
MHEKDIMHIRSGFFTPQLQEIMAQLPEWKKERPHGPKAVLSTHDTAAMTSEWSWSCETRGTDDASTELAIGRTIGCAFCCYIPLYHPFPVGQLCPTVSGLVADRSDRQSSS